MKMNQSLNLKIKEKNEKGQLDNKTIQNITQNEFYDSCEKILIENQSKFIEDYFTKINLIIKNVYGEDIFQKNKSLNKLINQNKIDFIKNIYTPMFKLCSLAIKNYNTNNLKDNKNIKISFFSNFRPHCMNAGNNNNNNLNININSNTALHICGGKMIIITDYINSNNSNINVIENENRHNNSFIICTKCKKCYYPNSIPMICCLCYSFFYSELISKSIKKNNCYLATWSKYHCKNINNEKMSCIKCGEDFWLRNNKLFCKKCKFEIEPNNIIWTCLICNTDFNSDAKIFNPLEFKEAQLILKNALIYKKIVKPTELPCKCISNKNQIDQMNFYHKIKNNIGKKECKGLLYYYEINNKKFIVCSLCYNIYTVNKFKWICPICYKSFTTLNIKLYHLKEKNRSNNNCNNNKNFVIKKNVKNQSFKNTSKKKTHTISILETDNSYNSNNNNHKILKTNNRNNENKYISPNKNNLFNYNIRNINSYIKKQPKDVNRMSSCYSSSSKDLLIRSNNNRTTNIISSNNNRSITNNNSSNKANINNIRKNNTINNGCLYSLNIKKRRNLSEIPNEFKNDIYYLVAKNNKTDNKYNSGTGSTIFSSLSNHNLSIPKESMVKANLELNLNNSNKLNMKTVDNNPINNKKLINNSNNYNLHKNKKINNNSNNEKKVFYYKNNKRNILICNNKYYYHNNNNTNKINNINNENVLKNNSIEINNINTINTNECRSKNNINLLSPKNMKLGQLNEYNNTTKENVFQKKLNKKEKGNKSFYIKDKKFILFSPENDLKNNNKNENNKRNTNLNTKNIFKINENQLELKQQQIPYNNSNNNSKNLKKK